MDVYESCANKLLCVACLCAGRTLKYFTDEKCRDFYLKALNEIPLFSSSTINVAICFECEALLRKAVTFKEQVQDSYRILQTYTNESLLEVLFSDVTRPPRLKVHSLESVNVVPNINEIHIKNEVKHEEGFKVDDQHSDVDNYSDGSDVNIKNEHQDSDSHTLLELSNKKKTKKKWKINSKRISKGVKTKLKSSTKKICNGSPKILEVNINEMKSETSYLDNDDWCPETVTERKTKNNKNGKRLKREKKDCNFKKSLGSYICTICQRVLPTQEQLNSHQSKHSRSSLERHRYHIECHKSRVQCPECDKTFSHRAGLMNHRLVVHELKNRFPCTLCDKVFQWKNSLKRHLEKHDDKNKSEETGAFCSPCGIAFAYVCSYKRHLRNSLKHVTHEQLKYICDHCKRRFADKTKLRDHIEEKHLHRTYHCKICNKPTKNRAHLEQHIRNVHVGRPNNKMCHHCGKGFPTKVQLECHIRTHTGERPFICELCPTTFTQQSNLYKHNRQVHQNIKSKRYPHKKRKLDDIYTQPNHQAIIITQNVDNGFILS